MSREEETSAKSISEEYQCNAGWILVSFTASIVMLSAAITRTILNHKSSAPEVIGYCSTLVKDNPYIQGSEVGNTMPGFARNRLYRNLRLGLVDVEDERDRGYIAIAQDYGRSQYLQPRLGRLYRSRRQYFLRNYPWYCGAMITHRSEA
jgi:hypothetical protein